MVNTVAEWMAEPMNHCSAEFPYGVSEMEKAGIYYHCTLLSFSSSQTMINRAYCDTLNQGGTPASERVAHTNGVHTL